MVCQLAGHEAISVDRGEKALELLVSGSFEVVFLDLHTRGMPAQEFMLGLNRLFEKNDPKRPIVVVLSASSAVEEEGRSIGADRVIKKPFGEEEVLSCLSRLRGPVRQ